MKNKLHTADHIALGSVFGTYAGNSRTTLNQVQRDKHASQKHFKESDRPKGKLVS